MPRLEHLFTCICIDWFWFNHSHWNIFYIYKYLNESIFRNKLYTSKKTRHFWLMSTIFCLVFLICVHFKHITHTNQPKHTFLVKMTVDICVRSYGFAVVCVYVCLWSHRSRQKTLKLDSIILLRYFEWTIQCDKHAHLHAMATEWMINFDFFSLFWELLTLTQYQQYACISKGLTRDCVL